jgi:hypothetical protein
VLHRPVDTTGLIRTWWKATTAQTYFRSLWRTPVVSFNNTVIWRERNNVVFGNNWRERMRVHVLQSAVLVGKMNHSAFTRVVIRLSDLCDDDSTRLSHMNRREPSFDFRIASERNNCLYGKNENNAGNQYQNNARTSWHVCFHARFPVNIEPQPSAISIPHTISGIPPDKRDYRNMALDCRMDP